VPAAAELTVAVLFCDGRQLLTVVLPSLARQRFCDFEVFVVDSGPGTAPSRGWAEVCPAL
jgi:hypothetical protein